MKKIALIAAMSLAALVSCTKNEPAPSVTDQQEITFASPIMSPATKAATEIADNFPDTKDFAVFAHYYESGYTTLEEGVQYMNNVQVTYGATPGTHGSWGSDPAYYWPKGGSLTFAAYAPYMATGATYDATGIHFSDYKIADSAENQADLLFSERAYDKVSTDQKDNNDYYYGVQINFLHALSSIKFKVAMAQTLAASTLDYEFVVTNIKVLNAYSQGDFNQKLTDGKDKTTPPAASGDWTDYQTETNYVAYNDDVTGISLTDDTAKETVTGLNATNLILLPQKMKHGSAADASDEVKVQVTYKMRHKEMIPKEYITTVNEVSLNSSASVNEWLRGKRYVYTLTLDLEEIRFAPNVEQWDEQTVTDLPAIQ